MRVGVVMVCQELGTNQRGSSNLPRAPLPDTVKPPTKPKWVKGQWWDYADKPSTSSIPPGSSGAGGKTGAKPVGIKVPDDEEEDDMSEDGPGGKTPAVPVVTVQELESKLKQLLWILGADNPETQKLQAELDTLVLSESVEEALRKVAKQDAVPVVIQMQRKCLHLVHLSKSKLKLQANLDGLEEQQKCLDELKEAARERSEKLEEQVAQTMVERDSLISAIHQADAAGTSPGAQNKVQEATTGAPVQTGPLTGAGSVAKLDLSLADIWCIQEHRLLKKASLNKFAKQHKKAGWSTFLGAAQRTEKSTSGGVGFLWRPSIDVASEPVSLVAGRVSSMTIRTKDLGVIAICSVYGHSGDGEGVSNMKLIEYSTPLAMP